MVRPLTADIRPLISDLWFSPLVTSSFSVFSFPRFLLSTSHFLILFTLVPNRSAKRKTHRPRARTAVAKQRTSFVVRRSRVHGRGVFAARPIRKGERIIEYAGRRVLWSSIPDDQDDTETYYFGLDNDKEVIDPSVGGNEAQWINHSCDPNCETIEDRRGRVFIKALRNIRPGEELSYDYHLAVDVPRTKAIEDEARCDCGSAKCRGTLLAPAER